VIKVNAVVTPPSARLIKAENAIAALLSIVPGLGHIYKGHFEAGLAWMFFGMPLAVFVGILFGLATAGIGLFFPILCWVAVAFDAYFEKDRRRHHMIPPTGPTLEDENEFGD
jgi:hypothetical protein